MQNQIKFRWLIPVHTSKYKHDIWGEKWVSEKVQQAEKILQYSLDGENWEDVECKHFEVPEGEVHKYNWNKF